jgi:hypothetical protein
VHSLLNEHLAFTWNPMPQSQLPADIQTNLPRQNSQRNATNYIPRGHSPG